jgi:hypothetical protein
MEESVKDEDLISRGAYFPKAVKTLGGASFNAREKLIIVEHLSGGQGRYRLMGFSGDCIESDRKHFRLIPKLRGMGNG